MWASLRRDVPDSDGPLRMAKLVHAKVVHSQQGLTEIIVFTAGAQKHCCSRGETKKETRAIPYLSELELGTAVQPQLVTAQHVVPAERSLSES